MTESLFNVRIYAIDVISTQEGAIRKNSLYLNLCSSIHVKEIIETTADTLKLGSYYPGGGGGGGDNLNRG